MAGGNHLLVDNRADVEAFSHAYIVDIFYFGYGFSYTHAFCRQTGKNVCFRVPGQCHKGFGILQSFFYEQVHIPSVAVDNHCLVIQQFGQTVTAVQVVVHDFHLHIVGDILCGTHGDAASTHNHDIAYVGIIFFACYLADIWYELASSREINNIMQFHNIIAAGNQCFVTALDGHHMIRQFRSAQLMQGDVQDFCFFAHLGAYQNQCAPAKFPPLAYPAHTDRRYNLFCRKHFRVDKRIYS